MKIKNTILSFALMIAGITTVTAAPVNDNWQSATNITGLPATVSDVNTGGSAQPCEPIHLFPEEQASQPRHSVWFKWQAPATGSYTVKIIAGAFPTVLSAYSLAPGTCNGLPMIVPYRIRENTIFNSVNDRSQVSFRAVQDSVIHFSVDSAAVGVTGGFTLVVEKTKYQYAAQLDYSNGAADLAVNDAFGRWWFGRRDPFGFSQLATSTTVWGDLGDRVFMADFDGDAVSDLAIARPNNGKLTWWIADKFGNQIKVVQFGLEYDRPIVGDWDGDGIADIAVTRTNNLGRKIWHFLRSSDGQYQSLQYGLEDDEAMVGDYDGDGKTDLAVLRVTPQNTYTWYVRNSSNGTDISREFGDRSTDVPLVADFDGDGKTDITMYRDGGTWYSLDSSSAIPIGQRPTRIVQFGTVNDRAQAADYDADGKTDYAIYRDGEWWIRGSSTGNVSTYRFGIPFHIVMTDGGIRNAFFFY